MRARKWQTSRWLAPALTLALGVFAGGQPTAWGARAPDGRGYELIHPAVGAPDTMGLAAISDDGSRVTFVGKAFSLLLLSAVRTAQGWHSVSMLPNGDELLDGHYNVEALTRDRSKAIVSIYPGTPLNGSGAPTWARVDVEGHQTLFGQLSRTDQTLRISLSDDGAHAFADLGGQVYDLAHDAPMLVSILPDGTTPACPVKFASGGAASWGLHHWNSVDGEVVLFLAQADCASGTVSLYRRDLAAGTTALISGPALSGGEESAIFVQAGSDGDAVVFLTRAVLDSADGNDDVDVYRWSLGGGNVCLTCAVLDADLKFSLDGPAVSAVASEDLSHVYFVSERALADGSTAGMENLYVWRVANGEATIAYVSPYEFASNVFLTTNPGSGGALTSDGRVLVFRSAARGLDARSGSSNGGHVQYYRYDERADRMTCVSCPPVGTPEVDVPVGLVSGDGRALSDDGSRLLFPTAEALVGGDVNGRTDLYEWHDGRMQLITDGVSDDAWKFYGISQDGRDVLFASYVALTPDAVDGTSHLYDARLSGGFVFPTPRACEGDACQAGLTVGGFGAVEGAVGFHGARESGGPSGRVEIVTKRVRNTRIVLRVQVPGTGMVRAAGARVRPTRRSVAHAGKMILRVRLAERTLRLLRRGERVPVVLRVRYVSSGGAQSSVRVRVIAGA